MKKVIVKPDLNSTSTFWAPCLSKVNLVLETIILFLNVIYRAMFASIASFRFLAAAHVGYLILEEQRR